MQRWAFLACAFSTVAVTQPMEPPAWAYPSPPAARKPAPDDGKLRNVPNSQVRLLLSQTRDLFFAPDWHPGDHPPMPAIVERGRKPDVSACGVCHRATGSGGPENANLSGLPHDSLVAQLKAFRSGARPTAFPERLPQKLMVSLAKALTDEEIETSAAYFSAVRPRQSLRVVEAETIPRPEVGWVWVLPEGAPREPLAGRIIEVAERQEAFELRDSRATFIAYVPVGSLRRGEALVTGKHPDLVPPCATCHGAALKGLTVAPPIAGRWASVAMRQLYEFKIGARQAGNAALMKPVVEKLSMEDLTAIAAYLASLPP